MHASPISLSVAAAPLTSFARFERPLLAFVNELLSPVDYQRGPQMALMAWSEALGSLRLTTGVGMEGDIPVWLADAARRVVREQTSPAASVGRVVTVASNGEPHSLVLTGPEAPHADGIAALPLAS